MSLVTQQRLHELFAYDPLTGVFTRRIATTNRVKVGSVAGGINSDGYRSMRADGRIYRAHRLAWLYVYGVWPEGEIDHRHGHRDDNRIGKLRDIRKDQNAKNRKKNANNVSGFKGVSFHRRLGRWQAQISFGGRVLGLGYYPTPELASAAYEARSAELFGEFKRAAA